MSALGEKNKAIDLYNEALSQCTDPETRGYILINLAIDTEDKKESERFLRQAVEEGHKEALFHLGLLFYDLKKYNEAISFIEQSIKAGIALGIGVLDRIYTELNFNQTQISLLRKRLIEMAKEAGIEEPEKETLFTLQNQLFVRDASGQVLNVHTLLESNSEQ